MRRQGFTQFLCTFLRPSKAEYSDTLFAPVLLGYAFFNLFFPCQEIDEPILFDQRHAGFMGYRPCSQTDFCTARLAIQNISRSNKPRFCMYTSWTSETTRPPHFAKLLSAGLPSGKFFLKFQ